MSLLLFLSAAAAPVVDYNKVETPELIPSAIRGSWDASTAACKNEDSTSRVAIGANWIAYYEAYGLLQISDQAGIPDTDESLAMRFAMAGEGSTWDNEIVLAWNKAKPNELISIDAKTPENMNTERQRQLWIRCV